MTVVLLALTSSGLAVHDIVFFGTNRYVGMDGYKQGTAPQTFEPLLAGVIAAICQTTLVLRASWILQSAISRWTFISILMSGVSVSLLGAMGTTGEV